MLRWLVPLQQNFLLVEPRWSNLQHQSIISKAPPSYITSVVLIRFSAEWLRGEDLTKTTGYPVCQPVNFVELHSLCAKLCPSVPRPVSYCFLALLPLLYVYGRPAKTTYRQPQLGSVQQTERRCRSTYTS